MSATTPTLVELQFNSHTILESSPNSAAGVSPITCLFANTINMDFFSSSSCSNETGIISDPLTSLFGTNINLITSQLDPRNCQKDQTE